ncbi:MAG: PilT/PilU family type 4a pilus ATPase [Deltaproteobacteria bacterium]|nr:MAG: PilT/PilU family type 4a pilus ATPase [Deltaproteobacteria bacterium]
MGAWLDSFLRVVVDQRASDLHLHAGKPPVVRLDGDLVTLPFRELGDVETRRFIWQVLDDQQRHTLEREMQLDFIYVLEGVGRFRANAFMQRDGLSAVFRVIPERLPTMKELLLPAAVRTLTRHQNGLVLVTGPTGSGKTTTLAAMIHDINRNSRRHIITLEDPIEFVHPPIHSVVTQRAVGTDVKSFSDGLRSALREAPDVLMVGELRDQETVSLALQAAETGVLVLGTLHTNSAAKAVDRIIDAVPDATREQARGVLSVMLRGIVAQQLCKQATGEGRIAALEVLLNSYAVANMIREGKTHQIDGHLQSASNGAGGMQSLDHCLFRYVRDGLIEPEEAVRNANDPDAMMQRLATLPGEDD